MPLLLPRAPQTDDELWWLMKAQWGIEIPRVAVCPDHAAPFDAVSHAFFAKPPGFAVWYASRGSGKSLALAALGLTKWSVLDVDVTILGGSIWQSQNVRTHMSKMLESPNAPRHIVYKDIQTEITSHTKRKITPLPASQTSVRGPHPPLELLDEIDEMDYVIYQAALGQAMEQLNHLGSKVSEYIVASSTWQNPAGTMTKVIDDARVRGLPIFTWCWRELLEPNGWMSREFIERKRSQVTAETWRVEYDLNEPSGASRAFDLDAVENYFVPYGPPVDFDTSKDNDQFYCFEEAQASGLYSAGADWAKEQDYTVFTVHRYDVQPRKLVYFRKLRRRPWPEMTKAFDTLVARYHAAGRHDSTGVGNVVHDMLASVEGEAVRGFNFTERRKRSQTLLAYIADFEAGLYRLPREIKDLHVAHRNCPQAAIYGAYDNVKAHLPDEVAASALSHLAAGNVPVVAGQGVPKSDAPSAVEKPFAYAGEEVRVTGEVTIVDERYDDVLMFAGMDMD